MTRPGTYKGVRTFGNLPVAIATERSVPKRASATALDIAEQRAVSFDATSAQAAREVFVSVNQTQKRPRSMYSIDERMQSFVQWHGEIPREAKILKDYEARHHAVPWIRHHIGEGIVHSQAIGYQLDERWWTLFFERVEGSVHDSPERWHVEAYDHKGKSWTGHYLYWRDQDRWRHALFELHGHDYGRHGLPRHTEVQ
jgi:hypothetical protein